MRIWLAPSAYSPHRGGVEEAVHQIARELGSRGHEVTVVAPRHPRRLARGERIDGIDVVRVAFSAPRRAMGSLTGYPFALASQVVTLARLHRRGRPDLVHVHCASVQLPALLIWCAATRTPLVLTTHGETVMDAADLYGTSAFMRVVLRFAARRADALTAVSRWTAQAASRITPHFAEAEVVVNGIDPHQWQVSALAEDPVFVAWGRLVPQKGFDLLLAAFAVVRAELPRATLLIGGAGPEEHRLRRIAGDGVSFVGPLSRDGVRGLLDASRVVVVPSRLEPFGIVALEAMATGRSVVWSSTGGLAEATGGLGRGVDPRDTASLARALVEVADQPDDPQASRAHAESMTWAAACDAYLHVYEGCRRP